MPVKKTAVIVAGGSGSRMGSEIPKQFLLLQGKPLLWHTIRLFLNSYDDLYIILVLPALYLDEGKRICASLPVGDRVQFVTGGATRFHSVQNGLQLVCEPAIVFVHDAVRCLLSKGLVHRCYEQALAKGSAIPAVAATDSIRIVSGNTHAVADRNQVRMIQTPQTFHSDILIPAFAQNWQEEFTDEATVVEASGREVYLIEGEYTNIKITRPADLLLAETIFHERF